jgi:hypothetical protein
MACVISPMLYVMYCPCPILHIYPIPLTPC